MKPIVINGDLWRVVRVTPDDPRLIDRTGTMRIATADSESKVISIALNVMPPLLDKVLLHEIAHAVTMSHGMLDPLRAVLPDDFHVIVEEWNAQVIEYHRIEITALASESLGRPVCVDGLCF